jgi:Ni,Fe-hydrogenase maturation factor
MSTHDMGLKDLVGALQLPGGMPEIYLFIVFIDSVQEQGRQLNPEIANSLARLRKEIQNLIYTFGAQMHVSELGKNESETLTFQIPGSYHE